jgi:hypothetical protein
VTRRVRHPLPHDIVISEVLNWCRDNGIPVLFCFHTNQPDDQYVIKTKKHFLEPFRNQWQTFGDSIIVREQDYPLVRLRF